MGSGCVRSPEMLGGNSAMCIVTACRGIDMSPVVGFG